MTTGRINLVATFKHKLRTECACIHLECMQEVLSIEKLQAEAASFTQTRSDLPMPIEARLVVFLSPANHKNRSPIRLGSLAVGEPSVGDAFRTLCSSAVDLHPSGFVYDCTM